jgi:hypothetical protein
MAGAFQFMGRFLGRLTKIGPLADGQVLIGDTGSTPKVKTISGDATLAKTGVLTILALIAARLGKEGALIRARIATTTNDSLSGLAARDGVTPVAGDVVLVKNHATGASMGLYVAASGAWARLMDTASTPLNVLKPGILVAVNEGTVNAGGIFRVSNATLVVGTNTPTFDVVREPVPKLTRVFAGSLSTDAAGWNSGGIGLTAVKNSAGNYTVSVTDHAGLPCVGVAAVTQMASGGYTVKVNNGTGSITIVITDGSDVAADTSVNVVIAVLPS